MALAGGVVGWNLSLVMLRRQLRRDAEEARKRYEDAGLAILTAPPGQDGAEVWGRTQDGVTLLRDAHDEIVECNCGRCDQIRALRASN